MIHNLIGAEPFSRALHHYLHKFQYSNAASSDLWNVIGQVSHLQHGNERMIFVCFELCISVLVKQRCSNINGQQSESGIGGHSLDQ